MQLCRSEISWLWCEDGSISVEFALWLPVFFLFFLIVADTSAAFLVRANMLHLASDLSRAVVMGHMTIAQAEAIIGQTTPYSGQFFPDGEMLATRLSIPFSSVGTGFVLSLAGDMQVVVFQVIPPESSLQEGG